MFNWLKKLLGIRKAEAVAAPAAISSEAVSSAAMPVADTAVHNFDPAQLTAEQKAELLHKIITSTPMDD